MHACSTAPRRTLTAAGLVMAAACTDRAPLADARAPLAGHALDFAVSRVVGAEGFGLSIRDVAIADLDGDGKADVLTATSGGAALLATNVDGTLKGPRAFAIGGRAYHLATGDFDGDGVADVALTFNFDASDGVAVLLGDGRGGLRQGAVSARRSSLHAESSWPWT